VIWPPRCKWPQLRLPDHLVPQVVLLSDGNETQGQIARAALGAAVPIDVVPLPSFSEPDACLIQLRARAPSIPVAGTVHLEAVAYSNHAGPARLQVTIDDQASTEQPVDLIEGENRFPLSIPTSSPGRRWSG
jgi:Ca-activated chloride channel homolog